MTLFQPQFTTTTKKTDNLYGGNTIGRLAHSVVIASGEGLLKRGDVIGKRAKASGTPVAGVGNTGDGTLDSVALAAKAKLGTYKVTMTGATTFDVQDPDGNLLPSGPDLSPYTSPQIDFDITAGATPFVAGDSFDVPVIAGDGKYIKAVAAPSPLDGSNEAENLEILLEDIDATASDVTSSGAFRGEFQKGSVTFDASLSALEDSLIEGMQKKNIFIFQENEATIPA